MRALEQLALHNKPDKIKQTIRELEQQERVGKLDHRGELKLIANKRILHKKMDKLNGGPGKGYPGAVAEEFRFTRDEILNNRITERGDIPAPLPDPLALPGYEPNSSLRPTGLPQHSRRPLVNEGTVAHAPVLYSQLKAPPTRAQRAEADPLTSEGFENEMLHHIKPSFPGTGPKHPLSTLKRPTPPPPPSMPPPDVAAEGLEPAAGLATHSTTQHGVIAPTSNPSTECKPTQTSASTGNTKEKASDGGAPRPQSKLFVPSSVLAKKRQKEVVPEVAIKKPSADQSFRNVTKVPAPDGLLQFDLEDDEVERDRAAYTQFIRDVNH
jgi:hypothetical protein